MNELFLLPPKYRWIPLVATVLMFVVSVAVLKYIIVNQTAQRLCFIWWTLGACITPKNCSTLKYWIYSPMLGVGIYIATLLYKFANHFSK